MCCIVFFRAATSDEKTVLSWINALGLIFVSMPVS